MDLANLISTYEGSKVPKYIRVLIYGKPGTWKTSLASTFPKVFFVDADLGLNSVTQDIPRIQFERSTKEPYELVSQVLDDAKVKRGIFAEGGKAFGTETIALDSLTTIGDAFLAQIMRKNGKDPVADKPGFDEWGVFQRRMIEISLRVKDLSQLYNVVETAWETIRTDEDTKEVAAYPSIPGSYRERAGGDVDELWYMESRKGTDGLEVTLHAAPKGIYNAKTRVLGDLKIVNPTYEKLLASMQKKRARK